MRSTAQTNELAVNGTKTGLLNLHDDVTWEATHFGVRQQLTSHITACEPYQFFQDKMVSGAFQSFTHDHHFFYQDGISTVEDKFKFESPFGPIGTVFDNLVLTEYMHVFLKHRLDVIKLIAESDEWKKYLAK
ncbi:MAG: SRPBCC family protein [Cyanobacteria bacterium P01_D01_bin.36]